MYFMKYKISDIIFGQKRPLPDRILNEIFEFVRFNFLKMKKVSEKKLKNQKSFYF